MKRLFAMLQAIPSGDIEATFETKHMIINAVHHCLEHPLEILG